MANSVLIVVAVIMVVLMIYATYTIFVPHSPAGGVSIPISLSTALQTTTVNVSQSNTLASNSVRANPSNVIMIYENDLNGATVQHYISPNTITVISGTSITFYVVNNGVVPHNLRITGTGFNASVSDILPGQHALLNFTAPPPGNYLVYSTHPGDRALGFNATMIAVNST